MISLRSNISSYDSEMTNKTKILVIGLAICFCLISLNNASGSDCSFTGVWNVLPTSIWGEMTLTQTGSSVTGTYTFENGKITGTVSGNTLTGKWSQAPTYSEPNSAGDFEFHISSDCKSFIGKWRFGPSGTWREGTTGTWVKDAPSETPQVLIFDSSNHYLGGCDLTDSSTWTLDKDIYVTTFQIWYSWNSGETTVSFDIKKDGVEFASGEAARANCDPYQKQWCNGDYKINKVFPKGTYTAKVSSARQCKFPGGTGVVRLYGPKEVIPPVPGDCDGDGLVTSRDALAALQMSVGKIKFDLCYDVTKDGKVDSADAREILKKAVKKG